MNSTTAASKEGLVFLFSLETSAQTEKMITPLPVPQRTLTGVWIAVAPVVPQNAPQEMASNKEEPQCFHNITDEQH